MHDIKLIRDNPAAFDAGLKARGLEALSASLIALDDRRRRVIADLQGAQERRNAASKEIGAAMGRKDMATAEALKAEVAALKDRLAVGEAEQRDAEAELRAALETIPNIPAADVPPGADERGNKLYRTHGVKPAANHLGAQHFEIGEAMGLMDFEAASKMSGSRFVVLKGQLARLERAIGQFMIDLHTQPEDQGGHGYTEVAVPLLVKAPAVYGVGQLPKFEEDLFKTTNDFYLTPTAEVTLTNLVREMVLEQKELPLRFTALTPCFRSEAGAAGRDTRGMLRQHQFQKCELVSITTPETSKDEHERMLVSAENVLKKLGLHYRVMILCTGDMGFGSQKTYDIEAWLPGQGAYREISSCSVCGDFQARRMEARYRPADGKGPRYVHTLNGSGLAVGRTLIAVLENYLNADGSVSVPDALLPYMGGVTRIEAIKK
ncbi:MAG: serine--tRNA ligase [Methylocystis sp.]|nr:serine--tRNA ligase [Methylocystis sp.]MCA3584037.1 serine--tRNA ligase [Methylocystis sp.]MCA3586681.1 serine--tRNA ligase [Methylocystis sp.]MCA3591651.1 serine--tRNA ligase [Methylocystis sp.]